jgi:hypothetical protein
MDRFAVAARKDTFPVGYYDFWEFETYRAALTDPYLGFNKINSDSFYHECVLVDLAKSDNEASRHILRALVGYVEFRLNNG